MPATMRGGEPPGRMRAPGAVRRLALILVLTAIGPGSCARGPAPTLAPPVNRPPFVRIACRPCQVSPGAAVRLLAEASDPDGDPIDYRWRASEGTLTRATTATVTWTSPAQPGAVPLVVTVTDGRGGAASDSITLVVRPQ